MKRILCSTGAILVRANGRDHRLLATYAEQLRCDGFELMLYSTWYDNLSDRMRDIRAMQLSIPVLHCEKNIGELISRKESGDEEEALRLFRINCEAAETVGAPMLVLHLWSGIPSDRDIRHNIAVCRKLLEIAKAYGRILTIENVVCNHVDPMTHMGELAACYPEILFTFDTKMAAFHSQLSLLYEEEWQWLFRGGHIAHFHVNDYAGGHMDWANLKTLHVHDGKIDFDRLFAFLQEKGYAGDYTVEATSVQADGTLMVEKLNRTLDAVRVYSVGKV